MNILEAKFLKYYSIVYMPIQYFIKNIATTTLYVAKLKNLYFLNKDFFVIVVKYQEYG